MAGSNCDEAEWIQTACFLAVHGALIEVNVHVAIIHPAVLNVLVGVDKNRERKLTLKGVHSFKEKRCSTAQDAITLCDTPAG